jgi:hypothetical protein
MILMIMCRMTIVESATTNVTMGNIVSMENVNQRKLVTGMNNGVMENVRILIIMIIIVANVTKNVKMVTNVNKVNVSKNVNMGKSGVRTNVWI